MDEATKPYVLVVDDDEMLRMLARRTLERAGFRVAERSNGDEALRAFDEEPPDVLVLDVMMPHTNGFDACREVRRRPGGAALPIVMLTGLEDGTSIDEAYLAGATDFVTKPVNYTLLAHRLRYVLRASREARARRVAEARAHELAYFDEVTGLPNRAFLREILEETLERDRESTMVTAVLALELDLLKRVADALGKSGSEAVLREVVARMSSALASNAHVAARGGSNQFLIVMREVPTRADVADAAERLTRALRRPFDIGAQTMFVAANVGIAMVPEHGHTADVLLENADAALLHAKERKERWQFFSAQHVDSDVRRMEMETELHAALVRSGITCAETSGPSEFDVFYQPKVHMPGGVAVGVEALVRWKRGDKFVSPAEFIPVAEDTGLIVPLGNWVLKTACAAVQSWAQRGVPVRVAVNVAPRQFREPGFVELVAATLAETGLRPDLLELEITEGSVMESSDSSACVLAGLKELGVRIALDDFGTGYSSLSYLTSLPIDVLKIDRSFVKRLGSCAKTEHVTDAIVKMSQGLGIDVVAEGVETDAQLAFFVARGAVEIQGYIFAKPMPEHAMLTWLADRTYTRRSAAPRTSMRSGPTPRI